MNTVELQDLVDRTPFRPFIVRLSNGGQYQFNVPRDLGMTKNFKALFYFGESHWVMIDTDNIVEIIAQNPQISSLEEMDR